MSEFVVYNMAGQILRTGHCPDCMIDIQATESGEHVLTGKADIDLHYIDIETLEIVEKPTKPTGECFFDYAQKAWICTPKSTDNIAAEARSRRFMLLTASDWTQLPDVPKATKDAWAPYRQALRDITAQSGFPLDINWPTSPV